MTQIGTRIDLEPSEAQLWSLTAAASAAASSFADSGAALRTSLLEAVADAVDGHVDELVALADEETALGEARLRGEVARTTGQLRLFGDVVREGSYLEATIDHADPAATPPRPDLRRMLHAVGPVAVFSASNFPFAFSVAGGDTASALAAGCPVIVKAHSGHPRLSERVASVVDAAVRETGAPEGTFACVSGRDTGRLLVQDPAVRAVGFTGSQSGGRVLFDLAVARSDPIPFFGELGSLNPVVITAEAVRRRGPAIAGGLVGSFTLGLGQFCTKPGIVAIPRGAGFEGLLAQELGDPGTGRMLTPRIAEGFRAGLDALAQNDGVEVVAGSGAQPDDAALANPVVLATDVGSVLAARDVLLEECFGPACLLVRYDDDSELSALVETLPGALGVAVHAEPGEEDRLSEMFRRLRDRGGRVIWNGWPTGVAVVWSMHHGGPWPATTNPLHTSVGATAIRRFLRPVCYQNVPAALLPAALQDDNPLGIPRRVDGRLSLG